MDNARDRAKELQDAFVAVEHLLLAIADDARFGQDLFQKELKVSTEQLEAAIVVLRKGQTVTDQSAESKYDALSKYARDLTDEARNGKLDPVIGRDDEIRRSIQILSRRSKNNPVLIGEIGGWENCHRRRVSAAHHQRRRAYFVTRRFNHVFRYGFTHRRCQISR